MSTDTDNSTFNASETIHWIQVIESMRTSEGLALYHGVMRWRDELTAQGTKAEVHILAKNTEAALVVLGEVLKTDFPSLDPQRAYLSVTPVTFFKKS